ncbi:MULTISPECIES: hypothetical protein [unclassified Schlesneria]|uniref:hypothetical protein n=1 Tax=unclassified Schlesneria TaxID=2762017 RepID=UPI002EE41071
MRFTKSNRLIAAAFVLVLGSADRGFSQQGPNNAGYVRITDGRPRTTVQPASARNAQGVQQVGGHHLRSTPCPTGNCEPVTGYIDGSCPTGNCPPGGACPPGHHCHGCLHGKFGEHYCKHSPDYGYSPPAKYPLQRRGVEYKHYFPAQWYGAGADYSQSTAPMVYQPTDTTQLGYKYQHVPFWQPDPSRLPPRPVPAQWHIHAPAVQASRFCNGQWAGYMGPYTGGHFGHHGHFGHGVNSYYTNGAIDGNCPPNTVPSAVPQPIPQGSDVVPPIQSAPGSIEAAPQPLDSVGIEGSNDDFGSDSDLSLDLDEVPDPA